MPLGRRSRRAPATAMLAAVALLAASCERERRDFQSSPPPPPEYAISLTDLHPGGSAVPSGPSRSPFDGNAYALSEGKRLFSAYNCTGCHANGGGGMGPALIDDEWLYGSGADQVYRTILEGRPNGMPTFRGKVPDSQIWQLTAYVRSMNGWAPKDAAPNRVDHMSGPRPESATVEQAPRNATPGVAH